jgi:hypothetical protein
MADLDFFFDPVCPWAWITSRWVVEVQELRNYTVSWKFISLKILNQDKMDYASMPAGYKDVHAAGTSCLRVAAKARSVAGNDAVAKVYTALGFSLHNKQERELFVADIEGHIAGLLSQAGLPVEWALSANDESFDRLIAEETAMGLERAGKDVGTPIITFNLVAKMPRNCGMPLKPSPHRQIWQNSSVRFVRVQISTNCLLVLSA